MKEQVRSSKVAQKLVSLIVDGTRLMAVLHRDIEVKRAIKPVLIKHEKEVHVL